MRGGAGKPGRGAAKDISCGSERCMIGLLCNWTQPPAPSFAGMILDGYRGTAASSGRGSAPAAAALGICGEAAAAFAAAGCAGGAGVCCCATGLGTHAGAASDCCGGITALAATMVGQARRAFRRVRRSERPESLRAPQNVLRSSPCAAVRRRHSDSGRGARLPGGGGGRGCAVGRRLATGRGRPGGATAIAPGLHRVDEATRAASLVWGRSTSESSRVMKNLPRHSF